jgi:hypothetical protein
MEPFFAECAFDHASLGFALAYTVMSKALIIMDFFLKLKHKKLVHDNGKVN